MERSVRRRIIISLSIALAAGLYTWLSIGYWSGFKADLEHEQQTLIRAKTAALSGKAPSQRLAAVRQLDGTVQHRAELCRASPVFAWQAWVIPPIRQGIADCHNKTKSLDAVATPLHDLRQYLDFAAQLEAAIEPLRTPRPIPPSQWGKKGLQPTQDTLAAIKNLYTTPDTKPLKQAALSAAERTVAAWKDMIAADHKKDAGRFVTASSELTHAYADFMKVADLADATLEARTAAVTTALSH